MQNLCLVRGGGKGRMYNSSLESLPTDADQLPGCLDLLLLSTPLPSVVLALRKK